MGNKSKVVTTYLEMFERPWQVPPKNIDHAVILRAIRPTISFYRFLYNTVGKNWNWVDRRKWSDEELKAIVQHDKVEVSVLYSNGVPAGYVELDLRQNQEVEIAYFGLMPEFIGQGLGKYFLSWAIRTAWDRNPKRLWVHTCSQDHPGALLLYQKCGFKIYKTEEHEITQETPMTKEERVVLIQKIKDLPAHIEAAVKGLHDTQLDTPYREGGWTPRQVVHHVADSHMNAVIRMKLTLTENKPSIKGYNQDAWAELDDSKKMPVENSLGIIKSLHARWGYMLDHVKDSDWERLAHHSERGDITLETFLNIYGNHGEKHCRQITDLRARNNW